MTFTNVFYEETAESAEQRLNDLRKKDRYPEVKAYIVKEAENSWRVLRRIRITPTQPQLQTQPKRPVQKHKRLKAKKAGR